MKRAPELERGQVPEEVRALYDVVETLPRAPRLTGRVLAHSSSTSPAYSDLERLVIRYAEPLTRAGEVDDALHTVFAAHLPPRQLIELALTVAAANFSNPVNAALKLDLERP